MSNVNMQNIAAMKPKVVYEPQYEETQLVRFTRFVEKRYDIKLNDYWELHEWSYKNYPEFWECVWIYFDVLYSIPYKQVFERKNDFLSAKWFEGARLNYTANIFKYRDTHTALIGVDDDDNTQYVTYEELYDEVKVYVKAMRKAGIQKGDVVACYMPNKLEPVFAFLATAAIGATWSGGLPLLGVKGVLTRFQQVSPKILFTSGNFLYEKSEIRMDTKLREIVSSLPSLQKVVFVESPMKGKEEDISGISKCVYLSDFLKEARKVLQGDLSEIEFEQVPFDHPLCISYTSGTTGAPKCLVHSVGVFLITLKDSVVMQDNTRKETLINCAPVGWIGWHAFVNTLHLGLTLVMYEGSIFQKSPTRIWDITDKFGITSNFIYSCILESMEREGHGPTSKHTLKNLKRLYPAGDFAKPCTFDFITEKVKKNVFCSPAYGCTEVFGLISGWDSNLPVYRGEMQAFSLGLDVRVLDENDQPVVGKRGDIVIANPYPGMPASILNDENHEMMKEIYLSEHPGYWYIGDDAWINPATKGFIVYGRSDETMKRKRERFNCSDIYFALEGFPGLLDSVCVSQFDSGMEERIILFVKMNPSCRLTEEVRNDMKKTIEHHLSFQHVPNIIVETPSIPYNLGGKKMNGLVKKLINKRLVMNAEVVINPDCLEFYKTVNLG